jgi:hypothetical protein
MFFMTMPETFTIGDTASVRIDKQPATLTWRDAGTLVINGTDARTILRSGPGGPGLIDFVCTDAGEASTDYAADGPIIWKHDG